MKKVSAIKQIRLTSIYYGMLFVVVGSVAVVLWIVFVDDATWTPFVKIVGIAAIIVFNGIFLWAYRRAKIPEKYRRLMKVLPDVDEEGNILPRKTVR